MVSKPKKTVSNIIFKDTRMNVNPEETFLIEVVANIGYIIAQCLN